MNEKNYYEACTWKVKDSEASFCLSAKNESTSVPAFEEAHAKRLLILISLNICRGQPQRAEQRHVEDCDCNVDDVSDALIVSLLLGGLLRPVDGLQVEEREHVGEDQVRQINQRGFYWVDLGVCGSGRDSVKLDLLFDECGERALSFVDDDATHEDDHTNVDEDWEASHDLWHPDEVADGSWLVLLEIESYGAYECQH